MQLDLYIIIQDFYQNINIYVCDFCIIVLYAQFTEYIHRFSPPQHFVNSLNIAIS